MAKLTCFGELSVDMERVYAVRLQFSELSGDLVSAEIYVDLPDSRADGPSESLVGETLARQLEGYVDGKKEIAKTLSAVEDRDRDWTWAIDSSRLVRAKFPVDLDGKFEDGTISFLVGKPNDRVVDITIPAKDAKLFQAFVKRFCVNQ